MTNFIHIFRTLGINLQPILQSWYHDERYPLCGTSEWTHFKPVHVVCLDELLSWFQPEVRRLTQINSK